MLRNPLNVVVFILSEAELQCSSTVKYVDPQVETKIYLLPHPKCQLIILCQHPEIVKSHGAEVISTIRPLKLHAQGSNRPISSYTLLLFLETGPIMKRVVV